MDAVDRYYYVYFLAQSRDLLVKELRTDDPFRLSSEDIVERVLMAGYGPNVELGQAHPFHMAGRVDTIDREGQRFSGRSDWRDDWRPRDPVVPLQTS